MDRPPLGCRNHLAEQKPSPRLSQLLELSNPSSLAADNGTTAPGHRMQKSRASSLAKAYTAS